MASDKLRTSGQSPELPSPSTRESLAEKSQHQQLASHHRDKPFGQIAFLGSSLAPSCSRQSRYTCVPLAKKSESSLQSCRSECTCALAPANTARPPKLCAAPTRINSPINTSCATSELNRRTKSSKVGTASVPSIFKSRGYPYGARNCASVCQASKTLAASPALLHTPHCVSAFVANNLRNLATRKTCRDSYSRQSHLASRKSHLPRANTYVDVFEYPPEFLIRDPASHQDPDERRHQGSESR